jgi:hypothetical protein
MGIAQRNAGEKPISMVTKFYQMKFFEKCPASAIIGSLNMFALLLSIQLFKKFLPSRIWICTEQSTPARIKGNSHHAIGIPTALPILIFTGIRAACAPSNDFERKTRRGTYGTISNIYFGCWR